MERTVTCLLIPNDVQELDAVEKPPRQHGTIHSGIGLSLPHVVPHDADLRRAADALNAGNKVAMLVGAGALNATDEVIEVADRLGAGVAKALLGKAALPDDLPFVTGAIGLLGTRPSWNLMSGCDTLLMVGTGFPYSEFLPAEGQIQRGMMASLSGTLATMGPGVPCAIAAKFCHPSRLVVAMVGDGAMQMNGINGLITIAKYWEEWSNPRLVVLVLNN